jgi:hypothetical protein
LGADNTTSTETGELFEGVVVLPPERRDKSEQSEDGADTSTHAAKGRKKNVISQLDISTIDGITE